MPVPMTATDPEGVRLGPFRYVHTFTLTKEIRAALQKEVGEGLVHTDDGAVLTVVSRDFVTDRIVNNAEKWIKQMQAVGTDILAAEALRLEIEATDKAKAEREEEIAHHRGEINRLESLG